MMKCNRCDCFNDADASYCNACGVLLEIPCGGCGQNNRPKSRFCKSCGSELTPAKDICPPADGRSTGDVRAAGLLPGGERKVVTILFADLCGYSALSERLDPEEVKEIVARVFGEIASVVRRYEGFIEKYVGDAAMAVFGASRASEDDPIRAIRAAREIHRRVADLNADYKTCVETPLAMHTGINTGLVVLSYLNVDQGTHGISGETVNMAARLCEIGQEDDILVGQETCIQSQGWFRFERLEPVHVKGRSEPLPLYRLLSSREQPRKVHRISGRRGELTGRQSEMERLMEAAATVRRGRGALVCITGAAGTGKSRLLDEFRVAISPEAVAWYEGHAYPYAHNIPYAPLIDLLNLACHIEEGDGPGAVRKKIDHNLGRLLPDRNEHLPYIGSLFGLHYPEIGEISPESWRTRLKQAVHDLLAGLARVGPTVICIEDLHWADPSSVDLLRFIADDQSLPLLIICTYRKTFTLFEDAIGERQPAHRMTIEITDLTTEQTLQLVSSILDTPTIPQNLTGFIQEKIEGNPFFLEEMINALIDRKVLVQVGDRWVMRGPTDGTDISSTIHGVVSSRLDHLATRTKRVLQEASVIGRVFDYAILQRITATGNQLDSALEKLERLDMIRKKEDSVEIKYYFKHAMVQDVVYNGILIRDRRVIHERIAVAMEQLFQSRLSGFFETLALHYSVGQSVYKAIDYLMKSGQKSKKRYAVDEAHQYYQRAYELLHDLPERSTRRTVLLLNVLIEWFFVFNVRGIFNEMVELLKQHEEEAATLASPYLQGMFYCCMGWAMQRREALQESYDYLLKALQIGERADDCNVMAYACGCLVWTCTDMGLLEKAEVYGRRAEALLAHMETDQELIRIILTGTGIALWFRGAAKQCRLIGQMLLAYGEKGADIRSKSDGYLVYAMGHFAAGNLSQSIEYCNMAIGSSAEMVHSFNSKFLLAYTHLWNEQVDEAEAILDDILQFTETYGYEYLGSTARALAGLVSLARGNLRNGVRIIMERMAVFRSGGKHYHVMTFTYLLGRVYWQLTPKRGAGSWRMVWKNLPFLLQQTPFATRKAESNFKQALAMAEAMGAMGIAGQICFDMAQLYADRKKTARARAFAERSGAIFRDCGAETHLENVTRFIAERL